MPCWTVREQQVSVTVAFANGQLLFEGLQATEAFTGVEAGANTFRAYHRATGQWVTVRDGKLECRAGTEGQVEAAMKLAYSKQAVRVATQKVGWRQEDLDPLTMKITRRA